MMKIKQNSKLLVTKTFISIRSDWSANGKHANHTISFVRQMSHPVRFSAHLTRCEIPRKSKDKEKDEQVRKLVI